MFGAVEAFGYLILLRVVAGGIEYDAVDVVGEELLLHPIALVVVGVLVPFAVAEILHQ